MPFSFSTALSGLRAASNALGVTGNNIANANTTAFKSGSITFADVFNNSLRFNGGGAVMQIGTGVATASIATNFTQGNLANNNSSTSASIQGSGFFVAKNGATQVYTRAGDFLINRDGYLVAADGSFVQGYAAVNGKLADGLELSSIKVPIGETTAPVATTNLTLKMNLNSADPAGTAFHSSAQVYDSKGVSHQLDSVFTKQADGSYLISATLDGNAATIDTGLAASALVFDSDGLLTAPATLSIVPDQTALDGATLASITVNLFETNSDGSQGPSNITNFGTTSGVSMIQQDGFAAGSLIGVSISSDQNGVISAVFSNGQTRPISQFAVANFNAQDGMSHLGGNNFGETVSSGQPSIGTAGSGGRGLVIGGTLEQSNVDMVAELTDLIVGQRSFQANSRVINALSQTLQDLIQNI